MIGSLAFTKTGKPVADLVGRAKDAVCARHETLNRIAKAAERRQHLENGNVGRVIADEYWLTTQERSALHQLTDGGAFAEVARLDLDDRLAMHDFQIWNRKTRNYRRNLDLERVLQLGR